MEVILLILAHPLFEITIHLMIAAVFLMELYQHWSHHRKGKDQRSEKLYTLDEAKVALFESVAMADPEVFVMPSMLKKVDND